MANRDAIHEQLHAELVQLRAQVAAAQHEAERWRFTLDASDQGVWDWNLVTNQIFFSTRWKSMLGYADHEIGDQCTEWTSRLHPDDYAPSIAAVEAYLRDTSSEYAIEHRLRCKDGRYRWVLSRGRVIAYAADSTPQRFIGTHTDVSEHVQQRTQELELLNQSLLHEINERKRVEAALRDNQRFSQRVADQTPATVYVFDITQQKVIYANREITAALGYSVEEVTAMGETTMLQIIHSEDIGEFLGRIAELLLLEDGAIRIWEYRAWHRTGDIRWLVSQESVFDRDEQGRPTQFLGISYDVTPQKLAELERQRQTRQALLRAEVTELINTSDDLTTLMQHCTDLLVLHLDAALARAWMYDRNGDTINLVASSGLQADLDREGVQIRHGDAQIRQIAESRQPYLTNDLLDVFTDDDHAWAVREGIVAFAGYPLFIAGKFAGVFTMFARHKLPDDTFSTLGVIVTLLTQAIERRSAAAELRESEARLRTVLEQMPVMLNASDRAGLFIVWNRECERVTGYSAEEVIANPQLAQMLYPDQAYHDQMIAEWHAHGNTFRNWELTLRAKDGGERIVAWSNISERFPVPGWHNWSIGIDITARHQFEQELLRLNEDLEDRVRQRTIALMAANKELESFSYSVSHDLRAPLRAIDGFSRAVLEDYADLLDQQGLQYLNRICTAVQRMGFLIDDLLNLSRVTRAEMRREVVDLSQLAQTIIADMQQDHPERQVEVNIAANIQVIGDGHLLGIMLENLLSNAWKFTSKKQSTRITIGIQDNADEAVYYVTDNGAGFDMAYVDKLFGAFQRLHAQSEFPGTGIGLATVQRIVTRHGGRIWGEAQISEGATFFFTIPPSNDTI